MSKTLGDIVRRQDEAMVTMDASGSLEEAIVRMDRFDLSALVVHESGVIAGVITDRDILHCVVARQSVANSVRGALPLEEPLLARLDSDVSEVIERMEKTGARYVAVVDGLCPVGVVAHEELVCCKANDLEGMVSELVSYIHGPGASIAPPPHRPPTPH